MTEQTGLHTLLDLKNARIVSIRDPVPGVWNVVVGSTGNSTLRITGRSPFDFTHGFSRHPTLYMSETDTRPIKGRWLLDKIQMSNIMKLIINYKDKSIFNRKLSWFMADILNSKID